MPIVLRVLPELLVLLLSLLLWVVIAMKYFESTNETQRNEFLLLLI